MRLRARFTALFAILAAVAAVALVLISDAVVDRAVNARAADHFGRELDHLASDLQTAPPEARDAFLRDSARQLGCRITLIAKDGSVLDDTDFRPSEVAAIKSHADREEVVEAIRTGTGRAERISATERRPLVYIARRLPDGGILRIAATPERFRDAGASRWPLRLAIAAVCLLLFLVAAAIFRRYSGPIADLTRSASAIAAGDFARDLPRTGGEEAQLLSSAVQRMKDSLNTALERAEGERRLAAMVFETLPDGLVVVDAKLRVLESNGRFAAMAGVPAPAGRGG